ncbi:hypothetical protein C2S52_018275 [Perilla frutescens var. hirtella]|nr:hypothetical protein C2S52_018275 [Perilla frutescens var. hirtella]
MCDSWFNEWSPAALKMYQNNKNSAVGCKVLFNGSSGYEIGRVRISIHAMYYSKIDPLSVISKWYHKSTYQKAYEHPILPVPGPTFFRIEEYAPIEPPPFYKMPERPGKKRVRASNEPSGSSNK